MTCLEINATISTNKMFEFNQTKRTFIDQIQKVDGYNGFTEKPGRKFQMKITMKSKKALNALMKSESYKVFHGALITLSLIHNSTILTH